MSYLYIIVFLCVLTYTHTHLNHIKQIWHQSHFIGTKKDTVKIYFLNTETMT